VSEDAGNPTRVGFLSAADGPATPATPPGLVSYPPPTAAFPERAMGPDAT
jgi:hypothetical protein